MSHGSFSTREPTPLTPESRSTEFVPVEGGNDATSAEHLLVAAYFLMWTALLAFVFFTWRKQSRLDARLTEIDRALARAAAERKS